METEPALEFEFYLAQKLGRTVAELRRGMDNAEFVYWQVYYGRLAQARELAMAGKG
jgi:hypothetical protein